LNASLSVLSTIKPKKNTFKNIEKKRNSKSFAKNSCAGKMESYNARPATVQGFERSR